MIPVLRGILAVVCGVLVGSAVNMGLVMLGPVVIPVPEGVDMSTAERMKETAHLLEPRHFLFPFLAHAAGTFAGALIAYLVALRSRAVFAGVIGGLFLAGGISAAFMIPAPVWFVVADLVLAYLPVAWLAVLVGRRLTRRPAPEAEASVAG